MTALFAITAVDLMVLRRRAERPGMMAALIAATAEAAGHAPADLLVTSRKRDLAAPRQVAMFLCLELPGASLPKVARAFGRDHTTVLHAKRAVEKRMTPELAAALARIRAKASEAAQ